jgi:tetratricopeptide (TPR) repeat protein
MSILSSHAGSWHSDKWYRRAWYIWPQAISLLLVGWLFAGALLKPTPWAQPKTSTPAQCNAFVQLRDDARKKALAVRTAVEHKVDRKEICTLVQRYYTAESAVVKFLEENKTWCGIPDEAIKAAKGNHEHTDKFRTAACSEAPGPPPESDEIICRYSNSANALNACSRLIDADGGGTGTGARAIRSYFWRAQIYLRNEDYDRAIEDLSKCIQLNPKHVWALNDRGSAYEKKGELNKALADFREAQNNGSTTASEDINRIERAIDLLRSKAPPTEPQQQTSPQADSDGAICPPSVNACSRPISKYVVNGLDGLSLGGRVSPQSKVYQEYQCTPSAQFESVTWCNKQRDEKGDSRGLYRSSYTIAHSREGTIGYLNRSLEPAFFNAGEVEADIERLSRKFGEQARRVRPYVRLGSNTDGIIATWGKVALEPLDATGTSELAAGRSPRKGILVDFLGNLSESARQGLDVYRVTGGPGFVWAGSFNSAGQGTLRFFAIDPSALLPMVSKERTEVVPPGNHKMTATDLQQIPPIGENRRLFPAYHMTAC